MPTPDRRTARPNLETLDARLVPSTLVDLTARGATGEVGDGGLVQQCDAQPTGTGYIRSFVRVQGAASGGGSQQGYNTTARPLQFDENKSPQFTRDLTLGQVPTVYVNGVAYREFLLDINQKSSSPLLSLDEVRLYVGATSNLTGYNSTTKTLGGLSPVFDMDAGGDRTVLLNYQLNHGSGSGDMYLLVPNAAFAGQSPDSYVYLYSKMGVRAGASANAGFEEWAVRTLPATPPEQPPGTGSLSGRVFHDVNGNGVFDDGDVGIAGVVIQLNGTDYLGNTVVLTATTNADGTYSFTGLRNGLYSLLETQPAGYVDGVDTIGSLGGSYQGGGIIGNDLFYNILLQDGENVGVDYNFGEIIRE
jgi:hypothetical protein